MIVLGGSCEPLSACRILNIPVVAGPFDWFGIPTAVFPRLLASEWWKDVCALENIVTFNSTTEGCIAIRDLKYGLSTLHHFKRLGPTGMMNFQQAIAEQLPAFRERLAQRWSELRRTLEDATSRPFVVYRDYYPPWGDAPAKGDLERAYETLVSFAPHARLIVVTENGQQKPFEKAAVVLQRPLAQAYFMLDLSIWTPVWRYIATNKERLEPGQVYDSSDGLPTAQATNAR